MNIVPSVVAIPGLSTHAACPDDALREPQPPANHALFRVTHSAIADRYSISRRHSTVIEDMLRDRGTLFDDALDLRQGHDIGNTNLSLRDNLTRQPVV